MKKITLSSFLLCTILAANSLQAMYNNNGKRINNEKQNNTNNKYIKLTNNDHSEKKQPVIQLNTQENLKEKERHSILKEEPKILPKPSSSTQLPPQQYQIPIYPHYNVNVRTTNNIVFNMQPVPILNFVPTSHSAPLPLLMPNTYTATPQPNLLNVNMDHVKQFLANDRFTAQNTQSLHQEKTNYSNPYIFNLKEKNTLNITYNEVIKPTTTVTHVILKTLPTLQQTKFLNTKFPCTQTIDASALFGEKFSYIQSDLNKKENVFYTFYEKIEYLKEKAKKINKNDSFLLMDLKRNTLRYILNSYTKEPTNPCEHINALLGFLEYENTTPNPHSQNNLFYINNNNNKTQILPQTYFSQNQYTKINSKQNIQPFQTKRTITISPLAQKTNNTPPLIPPIENYKQTLIQNLLSNSPFANNNNAQNSNTKKVTPVFDTNKFVDLIIANPIPMDDFSDLTSETQSDLDLFYNNDTTDSSPTDTKNIDNNSYTIQNDTIFIFDTNERKCLAQKTSLPSAEKIDTLCFKICPTELEFFELSEFFYTVQKVDLSFVLKTNNINIKSILQSLKTFDHLKELKLEGNQLTDEAILWIAKELPSLEILILDNNCISDKGAEAISHLFNLKKLSIHSNQLAGHGVIKLAGLPNLAIFNYDNNQISETDQKAIYEIRKEVLFLHNADSF